MDSSYLHAGMTFVGIVNVAMLIYLIRSLRINEKKSVIRELNDESNQLRFEKFRLEVIAFFGMAKKYFETSETMLEMSKVYADLSRANNKDAKLAAEGTKQVITEHTKELHDISKQATENVHIVEAKAEELKATIPDLTLKKFIEADSGILKIPSSKEERK